MVVESESSDRDEDQFFAHRKVSMSDEDILMRMRYLKNTSEVMENTTTAPCLKKLFIRLKTPLPASEAAERLFSYAVWPDNEQQTHKTE